MLLQFELVKVVLDYTKNIFLLISKGANMVQESILSFISRVIF